MRFRVVSLVTLAGILLGGVLIRTELGVAQPSAPIKVVTKPFRPFSYEEEGTYVGFSIDLWNAIAEEVDIDFELYGVATVAELLDKVQTGSADVGMAGITITATREANVDFSYPFFDSGLQILVKSRLPNHRFSILYLIFSPLLLEMIGLLILLVGISAHIIWFFERKVNPDMFPHSYRRGIIEACWWAVVTVVTVGYGDKAPVGFVGRIVATLWMFGGIILISYFTASVSSALTVQRLQSRIQGPKDLAGRRVATVRGSTAEAYLEKTSTIDITAFEIIERAYGALVEGEVEAVVYDAPVLQNYVLREGAGQVQVIGQPFQLQSYGVVLQENSIYQEDINRALLKLRENGSYDEIYQSWFGAPEES